MKESSIKVGVIAEQTGPLSFMGIANANVAKMVINDINAAGGLLGRQIDLYVEDGATIDSVAEAKATKLVQHDKVDVIFGGIYSSTRQAIKGPAVVKGRKLYIYPEQYEGQECDPLIFCTGPVPAQQVDPFIPWLMQQTGAKKFYLPSADYIWPRVMNKKVREVVTANGGAIVGEEYFPLDHADYRQTVNKIVVQRRRGRFQYDRPARRHAVFRAALQLRFHQARRTHRLHLFRRELPELGAGRTRRGPVQLPRLLSKRQRSIQREADRSVQQTLSGRRHVHRRQCMQRLISRHKALGSRRERGGLAQTRRRDQSARPRQDRRGTGRSSEMVPGQHHVRMNMYIAQANNGSFEIVKSLGVIDPKEDNVPRAVEFSRMSAVG